MPGLSDAAENALLLLLFNNTNWSNVGDATGLRGSTVAGSFYIALHTADPTDSGAQNASEASYTGYARVAVARSGAGFTVSGDTVSNAALVTFGACSAGSSTVTHFSIGVASSGATAIVGVGTCSLSVSVGITPQFAIGALTAVAA